MADATGSKTPFGLGAFVGQPDISDSSQQALFEQNLASFKDTLGAAPLYVDTFANANDPIAHWSDQNDFQATSWAATPELKNATPVIGLPLASTQDNADTDFKAFASGQYDSMLNGMVQQWAQAGVSTQDWRLGWEMNLGSSSSYAGDQGTAQQQDWIAAFQRVSTVIHAAATQYGVKTNVIWNPGTTSYSNAGTATSLYPGSQYVDIIGADAYSDAYPFSYYNFRTGQDDGSFAQWSQDTSNLIHYYTYPGADRYNLDSSQGHATSLQNLIDFAKANNKPFAVVETGAGNSGNTGHDIQDNPTFVSWLSDTLTAAQSNGTNVQFVNIWDSNGGGNYEFSYSGDGKPEEAAAWRQGFGAQSDAAQVDCFVTGTKIFNVEGTLNVPVEELRVGDKVRTLGGALREISWVGSRTLACRELPDPSGAWPVQVLANAFEPGVPVRDLRMSAGHLVLVGADLDGNGGCLVPVVSLLNGTTILRSPVDEVTYWHVELDTHDILLAEGLPAESYFEWGNRAFFDGGSHPALADPDFVVAGLAGRCRPVTLDGPVVEAERHRLDFVFAARLSNACAWPARGVEEGMF